MVSLSHCEDDLSKHENLHLNAVIHDDTLNHDDPDGHDDLANHDYPANYDDPANHDDSANHYDFAKKASNWQIVAQINLAVFDGNRIAIIVKNESLPQPSCQISAILSFVHVYSFTQIAAAAFPQFFRILT